MRWWQTLRGCALHFLRGQLFDVRDLAADNEGCVVEH
jgi:hypothetical protein